MMKRHLSMGKILVLISLILPLSVFAKNAYILCPSAGRVSIQNNQAFGEAYISDWEHQIRMKGDTNGNKKPLWFQGAVFAENSFICAYQGSNEATGFAIANYNMGNDLENCHFLGKQPNNNKEQICKYSSRFVCVLICTDMS